MIKIGKRTKLGRSKFEGVYKTIEEIFNYKGFRCIVVLNEIIVSRKEIKDMKWRCGYIGINAKHPFYKKSYDEIEERWRISAHGGLTFSDFGAGKVLPKDYWFIGFDCHHSYDDIKHWTFERVKKEVKELAEQLTIKGLILKGLEDGKN